VIGSKTRRRGVDALLQERVDQLTSLSALSNVVARAASLEETYSAALDCLAQLVTVTGLFGEKTQDDELDTHELFLSE